MRSWLTRLVSSPLWSPIEVSGATTWQARQGKWIPESRVPVVAKALVNFGIGTIANFGSGRLLSFTEPRAIPSFSDLHIGEYSSSRIRDHHSFLLANLKSLIAESYAKERLL